MRPLVRAMVAVAILFSPALATRPADAEMLLGARLNGGLEAALARFPGAAAIVVRDRATGYRYAKSDDRIFYAASLYKLGVMVEAYRQAAAGLVSLDGTAVTIEDEDTSSDGWYTPVGATLSVREAIEGMITLSDNSPALALLRVLDPHNVNATMSALGLRQTRINTPLPEAEQTLPYNTTSARDMERLLAGLLAGTVVDPASSREMLEILKRQRINDRLPAGLPPGTVIAHKTGNLDGVAHDVGIIYAPAGPRIVVMLTGDYQSYDDVLGLAKATGETVYGAEIRRLSATMTARDRLPISFGAARPLRLALTVTNTSSFTWDGNVRLGAHWRNADGRYVRWDATRVPLPPLVPGASAAVETEERAPNAEGLFTLEWEMVEEGVAWSGDRIAVPLRLAATADGLSLPTFVEDDSAQELAERAHGQRDADGLQPAGPQTPVGPRRDPAPVPLPGWGGFRGLIPAALGPGAGTGVAPSVGSQPVPGAPAGPPSGSGGSFARPPLGVAPAPGVHPETVRAAPAQRPAAGRHAPLAHTVRVKAVAGPVPRTAGRTVHAPAPPLHGRHARNAAAGGRR